jgi:hypothetical protein
MIWRRENSLPFWDLNSDPSVVQPVAVTIPTALSQMINNTKVKEQE